MESFCNVGPVIEGRNRIRGNLESGTDFLEEVVGEGCGVVNLREHGNPKYAKMLELSVLMTVVAFMSLVGNSQMNLLKLSLQERI